MVQTAHPLPCKLPELSGTRDLDFGSGRQEVSFGNTVFNMVRILTQLNRPRDAVLLISEYFDRFISQPGAVEWARDFLIDGPYRASLLRIAETHLSLPLDNPGNIQIFNALGYWYASRPEDFRSAFCWFQRTLKLMPGNTDAIDGLISLYR